MEPYENYTVLEMLKLLDILQREPFPSLALDKRREELRKEAAKRLKMEPKEIDWLIKKPLLNKTADAEEKERKWNERDQEESKRWKILAREIVTLAAEVRKMGENLSSIKEKVDVLEKSYQRLVVQKNGIVEE